MVELLTYKFQEKNFMIDALSVGISTIRYTNLNERLDKNLKVSYVFWDLLYEFRHQLENAKRSIYFHLMQRKNFECVSYNLFV